MIHSPRQSIQPFGNKSIVDIKEIQEKIRSKTRNTKSKGPIRASYEMPVDNWQIRYQYRSTKTVQGNGLARKTKNIDTKTKSESRRKQFLDESSDYGTMSKADQDELADGMPQLNLCDNMFLPPPSARTAFDDISVEERQTRIESVLSDILSIPRLVEANLSQRCLSSHSKMKKFISTDSLSQASSQAGSVAGSRGSRASTRQESSRTLQRRRQPSLRRSASSPKLDLIPEAKQVPVRILENNAIKPKFVKKGAGQKQSIVPSLNLNSSSSSTLHGVPHRTKARSRKEEELSSEFLPTKNEAMKRLVPSFGNETQMELAISAPTLGDDTRGLDDHELTFDTDEKHNDSTADFIRDNMMKLSIIPKKDLSGRTSVASTVNDPKHRAGSVPKYLRTRKAEWKEQEEQRIANIPDPDCPPGHVKMPEDQRLKELNDLETNQENMLQDLYRLPVSSDTRRVQVRRAELESLLIKIEDGIRAYSRPKVFIKTE